MMTRRQAAHSLPSPRGLLQALPAPAQLSLALLSKQLGLGASWTRGVGPELLERVVGTRNSTQNGSESTVG